MTAGGDDHFVGPLLTQVTMLVAEPSGEPDGDRVRSVRTNQREVRNVVVEREFSGWVTAQLGAMRRAPSMRTVSALR